MQPFPQQSVPINPSNQVQKVPVTKGQQPKPQGQEKQKHYYFQTQSKRLKEYYSKSETRKQLISRKILFNNSPGIVRYVGPLMHQGSEKSNEIWVGVEWQEKNRGKHNGTVKGYEYFKCPQNQGSMVKYEKIEFGYKLQTALFRRYFRSEEMHHARNIYEELKLYKKEINQKTQQNQQVKENQQNQDTKEEKNQAKEQKKQVKEYVKKQHKIEYDVDAYFDSLKKSKKVMVEFVGFDEIWTKINNLDKIQSISLPDCRICDLGPKGHLNQLLKSLKILSLEDNLLSHYNQIYQLGFELPYLQELSLTNNSLAEPQLPFEEMTQVDLVGHNSSISLTSGPSIFPKLKTLVLINTGLKWKSLFKIIRAFGKLKQLVVCRNDLTDYENIDQAKFDCFDELIFLNLEDTNLKDFKNLMVFKDLPKLQKLTLNSNPIEQFGKEITGFTTVKMLSVQSCAVKKPVIIYQLSNFKNVQNLNFKHNPLNQLMGNAYVRLRSIAQFQKLTIINGAPLKKYQRKDSQIYYMRETFRQYFQLKNRPDYDYDFDDFLKWCDQHHPNIQLFIKRFGNPFEVQKKKQIQEIVKNQVQQTEMKKGTGMVKVKIHFEELDVKEDRKLPMTWTLANLKNFFAKTTKVPAGMQLVKHKNQSQNLEQEMTEDHKPLSFYNISPYSTIVMRRKDGSKAPIAFVV